MNAPNITFEKIAFVKDGIRFDIAFDFSKANGPVTMIGGTVEVWAKNIDTSVITQGIGLVLTALTGFGYTAANTLLAGRYKVQTIMTPLGYSRLTPNQSDWVLLESFG